jgi:AcrR family transcriptional regulator
MSYALRCGAMDSGTPSVAPSLRDRRRTRTRLVIQAEALRLFATKGYEQTTVEDIADAAAISPRTFFRYFPTRADVVLWDEIGPVARDIFASQPANQPLAEALRAGHREVIAALHRHDPERYLARLRLFSTIPELRARAVEYQATGVETIIAAVAPTRGLPADDLALRVTVAAMLQVSFTALGRWQAEGGHRDPADVFDEAVDALAGELAALPPVRSAPPSSTPRDGRRSGAANAR